MADPTNLCVITKDRPGALARCLTSYLHNAREAGRAVRVFVVDDSEAAVAAGNRADLAELGARFGVATYHLDRAGKASLADALSRRAGLEPAIARELVLGTAVGTYHPGANRNALLLALAGHRLICADDDTLASARRATGWTPKLVLSSRPSPGDVWALSSRHGADERSQPATVDVLGEHDALLGANLQTIAAVERGAVSPRLAELVAAGRAVVRMTLAGIFGDCGYKYSAFLLALDGPPLDSLVRDEQHYREALHKRQILRIVPHVILGDGQFSQTTFIGLDNRSVLPPFFPSFRGEDLLFGTLLPYLDGGGLIAHLPFAISHQPFDVREHTDDDLVRSSGRVTFREYLAYWAWFAAKQVGPAASAEERFRRLGDGFTAVARQDRRVVEATIRKALVDKAVMRADKLEARAGVAATDFFARDLRVVADVTRRATTEPDFHCPEELAGLGTDAGVATAIAMVGTMGRWLGAWPQLFEAARRDGTTFEHFAVVSR